MKTCTKCHKTLPLTEFYKNPTYTCGLFSSCKNCHSQQNKLWIKNNRARYLTLRRKMTLKRRYDLTENDVIRLLHEQDGCAICHTSTPGGKNNRFCVDHNHQTGLIRGLLCNRCNLGLGKLKDDLDILDNVLTYLQSNFDWRIVCKTCIVVKKKKTRSQQHVDWLLRRNYGITLDEREYIFFSQGNCCAVCKTTVPVGRGWHVDHCHLTNSVRGILCDHCNRGLGLFNDDIKLIEAAIKYLRKHKS